MTSRFTLTVHMLGFIAWCEAHRGAPATSEQMAASINTHPVVVRRLLGDLREAGLVETKRGTGGGVRLLRPAAQITLRDVYEAVEQGEELFCLHPNPPSKACAVGSRIATYLREIYGEAEEVLKRELEATTIANVNDALAERGRACRGEAETAAALASEA